ncbi:helix-turn-helix domain-containing protein [Paenibacillus kandeliae]|uniref:helix-turn-helix domain-containing protein n=1 Tax=Paenibacillus kandeliae TaxID=3231269 RepID=UPI003459699C
MKKNFGDFLRNLRKEKKLTVRKLAALSEVSQSYITNVENNKRGTPSPDILKKLATALETDTLTLMKEAGYIEGGKMDSFSTKGEIKDVLISNVDFREDIRFRLLNLIITCVIPDDLANNDNIFLENAKEFLKASGLSDYLYSDKKDNLVYAAEITENILNDLSESEKIYLYDQISKWIHGENFDIPNKPLFSKKTLDDDQYIAVLRSRYVPFEQYLELKKEVEDIKCIPFFKSISYYDHNVKLPKELKKQDTSALYEFIPFEGERSGWTKIFLSDYDHLDNTEFLFQLFSIKVPDEGMINEHICKHDTAIIQITENLNNNDIALISIKGDNATLRKINFFDGHCFISAANPNYDPQILLDFDVHVIGKLIGIQRDVAVYNASKN